MHRMNEAAPSLADFEAGRVTPSQFSHREHVRIAYELLERHRFPEALLHLARGLRQLAARAGHPEKYHETMTAAFLALIAERRWESPARGWQDFAERNPDLLEGRSLENFYDPARLESPAARATFLLPHGIRRR